MELLFTLLEEEFSLLQTGNTDAVTSLEFSIHELLRQLASERMEVKEIMHGTKAAEYAGLLPPEEGAEIRKLLAAIDEAEQRSARQASYNTQLSLALLDQNHELMTYLYDNIVPKQQMVYGARGTYRNHRPEAALIHGRM